MKTVLKMTAYVGLTTLIADFVLLCAYGLSYGMTGQPEFHRPETVAATAIGGGLFLAFFVFGLLDEKPWEGDDS